jgi:hypothetical protein
MYKALPNHTAVAVALLLVLAPVGSSATPNKAVLVELVNQTTPAHDFAIVFPLGRGTLPPDSLKALLILLPTDKSGVTFEVIGRDDETNKEGLPEARTDAVVAVLVAHGVPRENIHARLGEAIPSESNPKSVTGVSIRWVEPVRVKEHAVLAQAEQPKPVEKKPVQQKAITPRTSVPAVAAAQPIREERVPEQITWQIKKSDETLQVTLKRWALNSGWIIRWKDAPDVRINSDSSINRAEFIAAADYVIAKAKVLGYRIKASAYSNNVLAIAEGTQATETDKAAVETVQELFQPAGINPFAPQPVIELAQSAIVGAKVIPVAVKAPPVTLAVESAPIPIAAATAAAIKPAPVPVAPSEVQAAPAAVKAPAVVVALPAVKAVAPAPTARAEPATIKASPNVLTPVSGVAVQLQTMATPAIEGTLISTAAAAPAIKAASVPSAPPVVQATPPAVQAPAVVVALPVVKEVAPAPTSRVEPATIKASSNVLTPGSGVAGQLQTMAAAAGWHLVWEAPDFSVDQPIPVGANFPKAVTALIESGNASGTHLRAKFYIGNNTVRVIGEH